MEDEDPLDAAQICILPDGSTVASWSAKLESPITWLTFSKIRLSLWVLLGACGNGEVYGNLDPGGVAILS
jgi:hypothetical protein